MLQPMRMLGAVLGHAAWWLGYRTHPPGESGSACRDGTAPDHVGPASYERAVEQSGAATDR